MKHGKRGEVKTFTRLSRKKNLTSECFIQEYVIWVGYDSQAPLKMKASFAEYSLFYRALLQKRPTILRSLLIVAGP